MEISHDENQVSEAEEGISQLVLGHMQAGLGLNEILTKFRESSQNSIENLSAAERYYHEWLEIARREEFSSDALPGALIAGLVAAVVAALVWLGITVVTDYELGILAWGVGMFCGLAVLRGSGGRKGLPVQVVSLVISQGSVVLGKLLIIHHFWNEGLIASGNETIPFFDLTFFSLVLSYADKFFSFYDLLWLYLAGSAAWKMLKGLGIKGAPQQTSTHWEPPNYG